MNESLSYLVITDVGSTTTKAILLETRNGIPAILGIQNIPTTVEEPVNDVRIGVVSSIRKLETQCGIPLLASPEGSSEMQFKDGIRYLSTSSAGGGLQILVIGLTLFDSASSAKRAAYGAGGIILDTFAIDDKRKAIQQMLAMRNLHPDMILLCGGVDSGALSGVLRMAEVLRVAKPMPKFDTSSKIPTIYAGNKDAAELIRSMISADFDLHILPNLRPSMVAENLAPTQEMIQKLFMENVMERAPGYAKLKQKVASPILPTPMGVLNSLKHISSKETRNVFAFDIGGATTDVFSYINTHYQRTVSANMGMSYSAMNVARECGWENIMRWLPSSITEQQTRNYVANKCLNPVSLPQPIDEVRIEHALAREAIRIALDQHNEMHYNNGKIGFLDKITSNDIDKYDVMFEYQQNEQKFYFRKSDIDVIIGAGGIFAHAPNPGMTILTLIDAARPRGITEICVDKDFTTPHLGVLSTIDQNMAERMLQLCVQKLALHICPIFSGRSAKNTLNIDIETASGKQSVLLSPGEFHYIPQGQKKVRIQCNGKAYLKDQLQEASIDTELPLILDSRTEPWKNTQDNETLLCGHELTDTFTPAQQSFSDIPTAAHGDWVHKIELPYAGEILVQEGQEVSANDILARNPYDPPRLYLVDAFKNFREMTPELIKDSLLVKVGDSIDFDQTIAQIPDSYELPHYMRHARKIASPVRGSVVYIESSTGILVMSEIQDYSSKPVEINVAQRLGVIPKRLPRYLKVRTGDYVFRGDSLATRVDYDAHIFVHAPATGTVVAIDHDTGILTIQYQHKSVEYFADVEGKISSIKDNQEISIKFRGTRIDGKIGFGKSCHGWLSLIAEPSDINDVCLDGAILILGYTPDKEQMDQLKHKGIIGLVCYNMHAETLSDYLGYDPGVVNTGNEDLPYSVLILGGFGDLHMPANTMAALHTMIKHNVWLSPHTRIRAGVVRPFLAVSH